MEAYSLYLQVGQLFYTNFISMFDKPFIISYHYTDRFFEIPYAVRCHVHLSDTTQALCVQYIMLYIRYPTCNGTCDVSIDVCVLFRVRSEVRAQPRSERLCIYRVRSTFLFFQRGQRRNVQNKTTLFPALCPRRHKGAANISTQTVHLKFGRFVVIAGIIRHKGGTNDSSLAFCLDSRACKCFSRVIVTIGRFSELFVGNGK